MEKCHSGNKMIKLVRRIQRFPKEQCLRVFAKRVGQPVCMYSMSTPLDKHNPTPVHLTKTHTVNYANSSRYSPKHVKTQCTPIQESSAKGKHIPRFQLPLCSDQSHLKGFPLPIQVPPLGLLTHLLFDAFIFNFCQVSLSIQSLH